MHLLTRKEMPLIITHSLQKHFPIWELFSIGTPLLVYLNIENYFHRNCFLKILYIQEYIPS